MVFSSPVSLHLRASSIAALMAWDGSGAGMIPSVFANKLAASKACSWLYARDETSPSSFIKLTVGAIPWYRSPPAWIGAGMKV